MSEQPDLEEITRAAERLVPELARRLRRHGLGEIEVRDGELRLRVSASPESASPASPASPAAPTTAAAGSTPAANPSGTQGPVSVSSPAVGFFVFAEGLGPGLQVAKGDPIGHVEMLGVRHDVRAPRGGTVRNLVAESGEPVEYGQVVVELEPSAAAP